MTLQEFYDRIGGDYKATISRLPSEALIKKFVLKYPGDPSFNQLKDALAAQDWELAFRASHTLKGVAQNLGMDRLYIRPPPRSATQSAARSRWKMPASGRRWWPRMRKCWPRSGSCKTSEMMPTADDTEAARAMPAKYTCGAAGPASLPGCRAKKTGAVFDE